MAIPSLSMTNTPISARGKVTGPIFSEHELSLYAVARPSVVCLSSVTLVHPTQAAVIFRNISTALGTLAIR